VLSVSPSGFVHVTTEVSQQGNTSPSILSVSAVFQAHNLVHYTNK